jgi:hypothetical protein
VNIEKPVTDIGFQVVSLCKASFGEDETWKDRNGFKRFE